MNIVRRHRFNSKVTALELGYGIIGRPLMNVICYLVGETLIDSAQTRMAAAMKSFIIDHRVKRLLLTHHHEDHSGNALALGRFHQIEVLGHHITAEKMAANRNTNRKRKAKCRRSIASVARRKRS